VAWIFILFRLSRKTGARFALFKPLHDREIRALEPGVLFTIHDPNHALRAADRAYLCDGLKLAEGSVASALNQRQLEELYRTSVERLVDPRTGSVAFLLGKNAS
jgi:iron complex transport system ATP-binding protein